MSDTDIVRFGDPVECCAPCMLAGDVVPLVAYKKHPAVCPLCRWRPEPPNPKQRPIRIVAVDHEAKAITLSSEPDDEIG
jgi:hypothetical protein